MDAWSLTNPNSSPFTGPFFAGELSIAPARPAAAERKGRTSERVAVELGAGLRQRGASGVSIQVMDLSVDGFRAQTHLDLEEGSDVWLRLPGLESCHAIVMWRRGPQIGCKFERPLHPAVLEMIIRKTRRR